MHRTTYSYSCYVGVLSSSMDDFESCDDIYDAIGDILQNVNSEKTEDGIRDLCSQFYDIMKINAKPRINQVSGQKMLNAPINISELISDMKDKDKDMQSIWVMNKDNLTNVSPMFASYPISTCLRADLSYYISSCHHVIM